MYTYTFKVGRTEFRVVVTERDDGREAHAIHVANDPRPIFHASSERFARDIATEYAR